MSNRPPHNSDEQLGTGAFEPGASFDEQPGESADAGEVLPSWLQNFADTVSTDAPQPTGSSPLGALPRPNLGSLPANDTLTTGLPGWLNDTESDEQPTPLFDAPTDASGADNGVGFFSDDDLPEWLRSLGPSAVGAPGVAPAGVAPALSNPSTLSIPAVSRIWVTPHEAAPEPPSASLFASIAGAIDERPDRLVSERPMESAAPLATMPVDQPVLDVARDRRIERPREGRWSRKVLWLTLAFLFMAVVMLGIVLQLQN